MVARLALSALAASLTSGCGGDPADPVEPAAAQPAEALAPMSAERLLVRLSLDLRGVRPSTAELERVEADPDAVEALVEAYLADARFAERVVAIFSEIYLTRSDYFYLEADDFGIADYPGFNRAVGEEPLRLLAEVARSDRPWTDIVTADWTAANDLLVRAWPLTFDDPDGADWRVARYTDGRPAAGVLSTNGLWWRYLSTDSNANRGRANQISRILLCNDYLTREIDFDRDLNLLDEQAISDAIRYDPACSNCHNSLDPLAAYLYGFWAYAPDSYLEMSSYHPDREHLYDDYLGVAPSYYGEPGDSLADLGQQIAADPRFPACAVEQVFGAMLDRAVGVDDMDALTGHREAFLDGGLTLRSLFASVVGDARYRAADTDDEAALSAGAATLKIASPDLLASQIENLTGFAWTYAGYDMMGTDQVGLRTLAGGADGASVVRNAANPNATILLVQERLAEAAASYAVAQDLTSPAGERRLFVEADLSAAPEGDQAVAQIVHLHWRIFGQRVDDDGEEVAANLDLLADLHAASSDPADAWAGLLSALLRDPDFLLY